MSGTISGGAGSTGVTSYFLVAISSDVREAEFRLATLRSERSLSKAICPPPLWREAGGAQYPTLLGASLWASAEPIVFCAFEFWRR